MLFFLNDPPMMLAVVRGDSQATTLDTLGLPLSLASCFEKVNVDEK